MAVVCPLKGVDKAQKWTWPTDVHAVLLVVYWACT